jgi:predicted DNA-binding transcriptional regulator AlpA
MRDDPLLTPEDAGQRLSGVSAKTLERWRGDGEGPDYVRVGRRIRYRASALDAWLDAQTRSPQAS